MNGLIDDYPTLFLNPAHSPCISLYQPTHRSYPERSQDPIRYNNLLKKIEQLLDQSEYSNGQAKLILKGFKNLKNDHEFWNHLDEGLAVLANPDFFKVYKLPRNVPELAIVSDSFHLKPLIRITQSADRFQILTLTRRHLKLYEGNRDGIEVVPLHPSVPDNLTKALGEELTEPHLTVATYGKGTEGPAMHHGHGGRKADIDLDAERYFRKVDEAITKHHSQLSKLPLILAALPEYHHLFHRISTNPYLFQNDIPVNPDALSQEALLNHAWTLLEPYYQAKLEKIVAKFEEVRTNNLGSDQLKEVAKAAVSGRVDTLLLDADKQIPGHLNQSTGAFKKAQLLDTEVDDLLDDLGEIVLKNKGNVIVVPSEKMPTSTGLAAIYRY